MVDLTALWLPVLVSAFLVFLAGNVLWMALPFWHRKDYGKLPDEGRVLDALASAKGGQYIAPCLDWNNMAPEEKKAAMTRPMAFLFLRNPAKFSFGTALALYFLYILVIAIFVGYLTGISRGPGSAGLQVFRVAGTAGIMAFAFGDVGNSIWYGKPWRVTVKQAIDGVIYGLAMGGVFAWLWPH